MANYPMITNFLGHLNAVTIQKSVDEALNSKDWKNAMKVEMVVLETSKTWELVDVFKEKNLVGCS